MRFEAAASYCSSTDLQLWQLAVEFSLWCFVLVQRVTWLLLAAYGVSKPAAAMLPARVVVSHSCAFVQCRNVQRMVQYHLPVIAWQSQMVSNPMNGMNCHQGISSAARCPSCIRYAPVAVSSDLQHMVEAGCGPAPVE